MKKTLHIGDSDSWEGCLKLTMYNIAPKGSYDILSFDYSFCTACLPQNLSRQEIVRCLKGTHSSLHNDLVLRFADIDLKAYDKIVIWHTYDSNSLLLLYFFSTIVEGDLYHRESGSGGQAVRLADGGGLPRPGQVRLLRGGYGV